MPIVVDSADDRLGRSEDLTLFRAGNPDLILAQVDQLLRSYCGWHIAPSRTEDLSVTIPSRSPYDAPLQPVMRTIFLPTMHLTAVSAVTLDGVALIEGTDFEWHEGGYIVRLGVPWIDLLNWSGASRVAVASVTHGYDAVPADVQSVALDLGSRAIAAVKAAGIVRLRVGGVDRQFGTGPDGQAVTVGLSDAHEAALAPYRIPVV